MLKDVCEYRNIVDMLDNISEINKTYLKLVDQIEETKLKKTNSSISPEPVEKNKINLLLKILQFQIK